MHDLVIRGARVVDGRNLLGPDGAEMDVAILGEKVVEIAPRIGGPARREIDAAGWLALPGGVDPHVHLGLPSKGTRSSDSVETGTRAALFGGVTTVIDFTLQRRGQSLEESLRDRVEEFAGRAYCDHALHVCLTDFPPDIEERLKMDLAAVVRLGAGSVKIFTAYSREGMAIPPWAIEPVMRAVAEKGLVLLVHAEDDATIRASEESLARTGRMEIRHFPMSRPSSAEAQAIAQIAQAAEGIKAGPGAAIYFVHVSSRAGIEAIAAAGDRQRIFAETCPQYLVLDDRVYDGADGAQFLVAPPLRREADRDGLLDALRRGLFDTIGTDHCPFYRADKEKPGATFLDLPNGLPGVETRLPLIHTIGVGAGRISLQEMARLTATRPAEIFGLSPAKGAIAPGADADIVLFDPGEAWQIEAEKMHMNVDFSPYAGITVRGSVRFVLLRGATAIEDGGLRVAASGRRLSMRRA